MAADELTSGDAGRSAAAGQASEDAGWPTVAFELAVTAPVVVVLVWAGLRDPRPFLDPALLAWVVAVAIVDLAPVQASEQLRLSLAFPILIAAAMLAPPPVAAAVALVGSLDRREWRREISVRKALFIRSEIALSVLAAGLAFHAVGSMRGGWGTRVVAVVAAIVADYVVNTGIVAAYLAIAYHTTVGRSLARMHVGSPSEFVLNYLLLGLFALLIGELYVHVGPWAVLVFLVPLLLARQMFFRTRELERTTETLRARGEELAAALEELESVEAERRALLRRTVEAAEQERARIARELHDGPVQGLAAVMFRLDSVRSALARGDAPFLEEQLARTQDDLRGEALSLREVIALLRPPLLDQLGLEAALRRQATVVADEHGLAVDVDVRLDGRLDPEVENAMYRVAQEALANAAKHAGADLVRLVLADEGDAAILEIRDDGVGFSPERLRAAAGEHHLGVIGMRERVQAAGGEWRIESSPGEGTTVAARFPRRPPG